MMSKNNFIKNLIKNRFLKYLKKYDLRNDK